MQVSDLPQQFVIYTGDSPLPAGWRHHELGGVRLACHPSLPVVSVFARDGARLGVLLGWPMTLQGELVRERLDLALDARGSTPETLVAAVEREVYELGGRFVFVLAHAGVQRAYLDALGSQPAVFCPALRAVASTTAVFPDEIHRGFDEGLAALIDIRHTSGFFPFGTLPQRGCFRLLINHYVDLATFTQHRHWPTTLLGGDLPLSEAAAAMATTIRAHIAAASSALPTKIGLSAGHETRMMLACAKAHRDKVRFWTRQDRGKVSSQDVATASVLAECFSLRHETIASSEKDAPSIEEVEAWLSRTGYCLGGNPLTSMRLIDRDRYPHFALTGLGGEVCRAFYWKEGVASASAISPELLLRRAGLPLHPGLIAAGRRYVDGLPSSDPLRMLGLFYLENRVGGFGSVHKYGFINGIIFMSPLCHRRAVEAMLRTSLKDQLDAALHKAVVQKEWFELSRFAYNQPLNPLERGARQLLRRIKRVARQALGAARA